MFKNNTKKTIFILAIGLSLLSFGISLAQTSFTLEYPDFAKANSPAEFVGELYNYALGISASLAVIMIVYGGVKYAVNPGNQSALSDAKDIIQSSIWGIVLLAGAFLILNTINPSLTELKNPGLETVTITPGVPGGELNTDASVRAILSANNIQTKPQCPPNESVNCVNLNGLRTETIGEIIALKKLCNCNVFVTAGTEEGHAGGPKSHSTGYKVDLRPNPDLDGYITTSFTPNGQRNNGDPLYKNSSSGAIYALEDRNNPNEHWDVLVP